MNTPDPHHWTLNSCVTAFSTVCVYLGPFLYCPKLGAKGAEKVQLMQKFVPRSRVGSFHNECNLYAPLDPKIKFLCILYCLGAFGTVSSLQETWSTILMQKFVPQSRIRIFCNERARSMTLDPKLMFWCLS